MTPADQRSSAPQRQSLTAHLVGLSFGVHAAHKRHCWLRGKRHRWHALHPDPDRGGYEPRATAYVCRDCGRRA